MSATTIASDVRASDLALGMLLATAVGIAAIGVGLQLGGMVEAPDHGPPPVVSVAVRPAAPMDARAGQGTVPREPPVVPARSEPPSPPEARAAVDRPRSPARARERVRPSDRPEAIDRDTTTSRPSTPVSIQRPTSASGEAGPSGARDGEAFVAQYRATLRHWLAMHVHIRGSSIASTEIDGKRLRLTLEIDAARRIVRAAIVPTGAAALDRAAAIAMASLEGHTLPSPPAGYPGPLQRRIPVVFVCHPGACS